MQPPTPRRSTFRNLLAASGLAATALAAVGGTPAFAADLPPWILATFDKGAGYALGGLGAQQGWSSASPQPQLVDLPGSQGQGIPGRGYVLNLNPNPGAGGQTETAHGVIRQSDSLASLEFDVKVSGASTPSVAKLEVLTTAGQPWVDKLQVYFGSSIRLNSSPSGSSVTLVPSVVMDRWYHLRLHFNLTTGQVASFVDNQWVPPAVAMSPGPIDGIALTGFLSQAGAVAIDNLAGETQIARLAVLRGGTLSGTQAVGVVATPANQSVELFVDGVSQRVRSGTDRFTYSWDTSANPVPAPTHAGYLPGKPLSAGYWLTEYNGVDAWYQPDPPQGWTNVVISGPGFDPTGQNGWLPAVLAALVRAHQAGKQIFVDLEIPYACTGDETSPITWCPAMDAYFDLFLPSQHPEIWPSVAAISLGDEPAWTQAATNTAVAALENSLIARGLMTGGVRPRPVGVVYPQSAHPSQTFLAPLHLDWVGIEAYLNGPNLPSVAKPGQPYQYSPLSQQNIATLDNLIATRRNQAVAAGKKAMIVMQAYTRSFGWAQIDLVRDLQIPTYLAGAFDPQMAGFTAFSYLRPSGTDWYPDLKVPHKLIGEALGVLPHSPTRGNGRRTLSLRATDTAGNVSWDFVVVNVAN